MSFEAAADQAAGNTPATPATPAATEVPKGSETTILEDGRIVVGGKVFTPEAAAKKLDHGDTHIQRLEAEAKERDEQLAAALDRIKAMEEKSSHADNTEEVAAAAAAAAVAAQAPEHSPTQEISKEELLGALKDDLKAEQLEETRQSNLQAIIKEAEAAYGDDFGAKIDALADTLSMTPADAVELASNKPSVFRALFLKDAPAKKADPDVTGSAVGSDTGLAPAQPPARKKFTQIRGAKERKAEIERRYAEIAARNP